MQCMYCGAEISEGVKFCPYCGSALPVEAAAVNAQQPGQPFGGQQASTQPGYQAQPGAQQPYQQPQPGAQQPYQQPYSQAQPAAVQPQAVNDSGHIGWAILSFFIPIVGLILFIVWRNTKPNCAKMAGIGALIGFALNCAYLIFGGNLHALIG